MNERQARLAMPRRWFGYSLRTLLVVITLLAIWLGTQASAARRQAVAVKAMQGWYGAVRVSYHDSPDLFFDLNQLMGRQQYKTVDYPEDLPWLVNLCGVDMLHSVRGVAIQPFSDTRGKRQFIDSDLEPLAQLPDLRQLHLYGSQALPLTNDALRPVSLLAQLEFLRLGLDCIDDEGLQHLANLTNLQRLWLESARVRGEGLRHLVAMQRLSHLWLHNQISDVGLSHLPPLDKLENLSLARNQLIGPGLVHLQKYPNLRDLNLQGNPIDDEALEIVAMLTRLESIDLRGTQVTAEGLERLQKSRPNLSIDCDFATLAPPPQIPAAAP